MSKCSALASILLAACSSPAALDLLAACSSPAALDPPPPAAPAAPPASTSGGAVTFEAGLLRIEPSTYTLGETRTSEEARIWYALQPADDRPAEKPLVVLFNGGPGAATSILFAYGTGALTLAADAPAGAAPAPNADRWTRFANLLYVDARQTGFSYDVRPEPRQGRHAPSDATFNVYVDGADLVRVVLRFLRAHPALARAQVVLAGESFGGVRATVALWELHHSDALAAGDVVGFRDEALAEEIRAHFRATLGLGAGALITPEMAAAQFGRQVLIQPLVLGPFQQRAQAAMLEGQDDHGGDPYDVAMPRGWLEGLDARATVALTTPDTLRALLHVEPAAIPGLAARDRQGAFRLDDPAAPAAEALAAALGPLPSWDRYFVALASTIASTMGNPPEAASLFLENLRRVSTFITNAANDRVVYSPAIPRALGEAVPTRVEEGWIDVDLGGAEPVRIRFPTYASSGHPVAVTEPTALARDVEAWLAPGGSARHALESR